MPLPPMECLHPPLPSVQDGNVEMHYFGYWVSIKDIVLKKTPKNQTTTNKTNNNKQTKNKQKQNKNQQKNKNKTPKTKHFNI